MKLSCTGTGDALFTARFPAGYNSSLEEIANFIKTCDVRITNLETNLANFSDLFANSVSGGTWINTPKEYISDLEKYGFNFYGTANNHAMDYSYNGLLSTIDTLSKKNLPHAGSGRSLEEASKPAILNLNGQSVAIFALDTSHRVTSKAGRATNIFKARPGVNYLDYETVYTVSEEEAQTLLKIAEKTCINYTQNMLINTGFLAAPPPGVFTIGENKYTTNKNVPLTSCNAKQKARLIAQFTEAKKNYDYVFVQIHCHENDSKCHESPPDFLIDFCHSCIDVGVDAIFGGGCHSLRPIEIYKNKPIFYSLGDFIYQGLVVEELPADFKEKFNVDINASAYEALMARAQGGGVGLHCFKNNYQSVLPKIDFEDGVVKKITLAPLYLNFDKKDEFNGLPAIANESEAKEIYELVSTLSKPYGTKFSFDGKLIYIEL
jgi:poly-gamma-glutamate synthesis protein (capsule biosynthesis protein)